MLSGAYQFLQNEMISVVFQTGTGWQAVHGCTDRVLLISMDDHSRDLSTKEKCLQL